MFKYVLFPLALLVTATATVAQTTGGQSGDMGPDLTDARVNIPYTELKSLWAAAQAKTEKTERQKPPVESSLVSAHYQITLNGDQADGVAEYDIQEFSDQWTAMPLLGTEAQLESTEPADLQIIVRENRYVLVTNHPGKQRVVIRFGAKLSPTADGAELRMRIEPAAISALTVVGVPQKQAIQVPGATQVSADKSGMTYRLGPQDHLDLNLVQEKTMAAPVPSRWKIEPQAFVQFTDGKLVYRTKVLAHAGDGSGLSMDLELPPDANVANVTGADLAGWQNRAEEGRGQIVHVQWRSRDVLRREIEILYDLPQPLTASQWKLESPRAVYGEASPPLYLIETVPGLDLNATTANPAPRQLPRWLAERANGINFLVVAGTAPVQAQWLPLVETPRAVAESIEADSQIVMDGAVMTELKCELRHEAAFAWILTLPDGASLLASSVDGTSVNPIDRGGHVIEFSLPAGRTINEVKFSYTAKGQAFQPLSGKLHIELPKAELLTNKLNWTLHIPPAYEVAAFEGNVEPVANRNDQDTNSRSILLHREIFKGESPSADLFYQKPDAGE